MERWIGKIALVTGASCGIGADIARRFVHHGMVVYGCARAVERIEQIALSLQDEPGRLIPVRCDLTKEEDVLGLFEKIQSDHGLLHVCINNAGMSHKASVLGGTRSDFKEIFDINVMAVQQCTSLAVKLMQRGNVRQGQIININSMSGQRSTSSRDQAAYQMSKHALTLMTELARRELRDLGGMTRIAQISPGMVETEFEQRYSKQGAKAAAEKYASLETVLQSSDMSDAVIYIMSAPESVQIHDVLMRPTTQSF